MSNDIPYDEDAICDECGGKGAFDFMGDYFCAECLNSFEKQKIEDNYSEDNSE
jgi:hypothetical protein